MNIYSAGRNLKLVFVSVYNYSEPYEISFLLSTLNSSLKFQCLCHSLYLTFIICLFVFLFLDSMSE